MPESETEMTVEILLPMTAGQSHNWLVDMSLSITDISIGAEHWSGGKESTATSIIQLRPKLSTASTFYLAKLTAYSTWHRCEVCQETNPVTAGFVSYQVNRSSNWAKVVLFGLCKPIANPYSEEYSQFSRKCPVGQLTC